MANRDGDSPPDTSASESDTWDTHALNRGGFFTQAGGGFTSPSGSGYPTGMPSLTGPFGPGPGHPQGGPPLQPNQPIQMYLLAFYRPRSDSINKLVPVRAPLVHHLEWWKKLCSAQKRVTYWLWGKDAFR